MVGVSQSSVSVWVRDLELTLEQVELLRARAAQRRIAAWRARARAKREAAQEEGRLRARSADAAYAAGCMLFWAEGSRRRNQVQFVNSDPAMMRFFAEFLRANFDVREERVAVTCNLFADHLDRQREIEDLWLETLGLTRVNLRPSVVNRYSKYSKKKRTNKLPYGTCRLTVSDTRIVQMLYGSIQELAGFTREAWLDL